MRMGLAVNNLSTDDPYLLLEQVALVCREEAVNRCLLFNCHFKLDGALKGKLDKGYLKTIDAAEAIFLGLERDAKMILTSYNMRLQGIE